MKWFKNRVKRKTRGVYYSGLTVSPTTTISILYWWGKQKIIHEYTIGVIKYQTIGFREKHLGLPSVAQEYGDVFYSYRFKKLI